MEIAQALNEYIIVENFMSKFTNDSHTKIIEALNPFLNKKLLTQTGFVAKYKKPDIDSTIIMDSYPELQKIGITQIFVSCFFNQYNTDSYFSIKFNFFGGDIFKLNYSSPYNTSYLSKGTIQTKHTNEGKLNSIEPYRPFSMLDYVTELNNYQAAEIIKKQYDIAMANVTTDFKKFLKR